MRTRWFKVAARVLPLLVAAAVFTVTVGGPWYPLHLPMGEHGGTTVGCPLAGTVTLCPVNVVAHLTMWRGVMTAVVPAVVGSLLAVVLLVAAGWLIEQWRWLIVHVRKRRAWKGRWYQRQHPLRVVGNHLRQAFADGILHPKIYPAVIC